ncbi:MAG: FIST C-terminal domain-containing protein [Gammaproteobacteria bacterium]|nr:FIST C-terminal domain-containing protein [Gammaproteobacteria bacterium]
MYIEFESVEALVSLLSAEPLDASEYWLILLAASHSEQVPQLIEQLNLLDSRYFGALFPGLINGAEHHTTGAVCKRVHCLYPPATISLQSFSSNSLQDLPDLEALGGHDVTLLCFPDCHAPNISVFLTEIFNNYGNEINYFGSGTGYSDFRMAPTLFTADGFVQQAVLLAFCSMRTSVSAKHGWDRIQGPFVATRTKDNIIQEINWEPAETVYRSVIGPELADVPGKEFFTKVSPHYPLCIEKSGAEDVVRDPMGVTNEGGIVCLSDVEEGAVMHLMHGAAEQLKKAALEAVNESMNYEGFQDVLVCDCYSRVLLLGDRFKEELQAVSEEVKRYNPNNSPQGVIALGEIASDGNHAVELYNKTFGICLIDG